MSSPVRIEWPLAYDRLINRGLAYQRVCTDHSDRERVLDRLGECHEMWGIQRDGRLCRDRDTAVVVEAEASRLAVASDRPR